VVGYGYPLVSDIMTFWYGRFGDMAVNYWSQTTGPYLESQNVAMSFSWQGISVKTHGSTCISVLFRSGHHFTNRPIVEHVNLSSVVKIPVDGTLLI
jgi:hypothetical protein